MTALGRLLLLIGALLVAAGGVLILLGRAHIPLGRLPGDITYHGKNTTVYFPIVSSILVSLLLTLVLYLVGRFRH